MNDESQKRIEQFQAGDVDWYEEEFLDLYLGDKRLGKRLEIIMNSRMKNPNGSIPNSMNSWAKTKGAYRFFSNDKVEPKLILDSHKSHNKWNTENRSCYKTNDKSDTKYCKQCEDNCVSISDKGLDPYK